MTEIVNLTSFAGTNGQTISAGDAGWSLHPSYSATAVVINGRARQGSETSTAYFRTEVPGDANQTISASIYYAGAGANAVGLCARMSPSANTMFLAQLVAPNLIKLFKFVAGTVTQIGSELVVTLPTVGSAKTLSLEVSGTSPSISVVVKWDGETFISKTVSESALDAAGRVGIRFGTASAATDTVGLHFATFVASDSTAGGSTTHATTGAMSAQASVVSGASSRAGNHDASGAFSATAAVVVGASARSGSFVTHATSGDLAVAGATVSGSAARSVTHAATGAAVASSAAVTATASRSVAGQITTDILANNTMTPLANAAVVWSWLPIGRIGSLSAITPVDGTGTTGSDGRLTVSGLTAGAGILLVAKQNSGATDDDVFYQAGTVA